MRKIIYRKPDNSLCQIIINDGGLPKNVNILWDSDVTPTCPADLANEYYQQENPTVSQDEVRRQRLLVLRNRIKDILAQQDQTAADIKELLLKLSHYLLIQERHLDQ